MVILSFINENDFCRFSFDLLKNNCEISMPKSVNKPVKWVVRTTELEMVVTNEFCKPIANNKEHATKFWLLKIKSKFKKARLESIKDSTKTGIMKMYLSVIFPVISMIKFEKNAPSKKEKI